MKILYDHQAFVIQKKGGISRYFAALIKGIPEFSKLSTELSIVYSDNSYLKPRGSKTHYENEPKVGVSVVGILKKVLRKFKLVTLGYDCIKRRANEMFSVNKIKTGEFDVFHPTYYDPYFLKYIGDKPYVLTIHDMIHEIYPHFFSPQDKTAEHKRILAERATKIIAISENTKKDIIKYLGIEEDKISVVYHANYIKEQADSTVDIPPEFVLYVGGRKRWKNFNFFLESAAEVLKNKNISLVCVGDPFDTEERNLVDSLGLKELVLSKQAGDSELAFLYKHALFFVFPSLYEGFGIPILEAFSNGCPVALSNSSCFPEIAKDAAVYFDPKNKDSIALAVLNFAEDPALRKLMREKGRERIANFSLKNMCLKTEEVYCLVAN